MKTLSRLHERRVLRLAALMLPLGLGIGLTAPASSVVSVSAPSAPQQVSATRGNASALIEWQAPAADGGTPITAYVVSAASGGTGVTVVADPAARAVTLTGLANGLTYAVRVVARNSVGDSEYQAQVTVLPSKTAAKVPGAPAVSQVIAGSQSLTLPFSLGSDNGSTITLTQWSIDNGTTWNTIETSPLVITGLRNGTSYAVKLRSRNRIGFSSVASKSGKPVSAKNTIVFSQPADMGLEDLPQGLDATATGGTTLVKTSTPKVCAVSGLSVAPVALGVCKLTATNAGDGYYASATAVTRSFTVAKLPPGKALLWSEEFKGAAGAASTATWGSESGDGCAQGNCGWGNNERQWYTAGASMLDGSTDGNLVITAQRAGASNYRCYYGACTWTSGKLTTYGRVAFTYGQLEARIKLPAGGGTWPAFWLLGTNIASVGWPRSGEIDVVEGVGNLPYKLWGTAHMADNTGARILRGGNTMNVDPLADAYHTYAINWTPTSITWLLDGKPYFTANKSDFGYPTWPFGPAADGSAPKMYAILNIAMGGDMGGGISPSLQSTAMAVDWIRYYSMNGVGAVTKGL